MRRNNRYISYSGGMMGNVVCCTLEHLPYEKLDGASKFWDHLNRDNGDKELIRDYRHIKPIGTPVINQYMFAITYNHSALYYAFDSKDVENRLHPDHQVMFITLTPKWNQWHDFFVSRQSHQKYAEGIDTQFGTMQRHWQKQLALFIQRDYPKGEQYHTLYLDKLLNGDEDTYEAACHFFDLDIHTDWKTHLQGMIDWIK